MAVNDRQQGTPILLTDSKSRGTRLIQIPFGSPPFREERLQFLLAERTELIPVAGIEPVFNPLIFAGREVETGSGPCGEGVWVGKAGCDKCVPVKAWKRVEVPI